MLKTNICMNVCQWVKVVIALILTPILFSSANFIQARIWNVMDYFAVGVPLYYKETWGPCMVPGTCTSFSIVNLILDIGFWILISTGLVFGSGYLKR